MVIKQAKNATIFRLCDRDVESVSFVGGVCQKEMVTYVPTSWVLVEDVFVFG